VQYLIGQECALGVPSKEKEKRKSIGREKESHLKSSIMKGALV